MKHFLQSLQLVNFSDVFHSKTEWQFTQWCAGQWQYTQKQCQKYWVTKHTVSLNASISVFTDTFCLFPAFYCVLVIGNPQNYCHFSFELETFIEILMEDKLILIIIHFCCSPFKVFLPAIHWSYHPDLFWAFLSWNIYSPVFVFLFQPLKCWVCFLYQFSLKIHRMRFPGALGLAWGSWSN